MGCLSKRNTAHFCQPRFLMQCWRTMWCCTGHDATHWFHSILQPKSRCLYSSWTFPDGDCHTTASASALQMDKRSLANLYFFAILCENCSLLSKVSWNIFYSIVVSLDKRAQLDLSLIWELLPSSQDATIRGRSCPNLLQKCEMDEINCFVIHVGCLIKVLFSLHREHNMSYQPLELAMLTLVLCKLFIAFHITI